MLWVCLQQPWDTPFPGSLWASTSKFCKTALVDMAPNSTPYRLRGLCWEEEDGLGSQARLTTALKTLLPFSRALPDVHAPDLVLVTSWEEERTYDHRLSSQMRKQRYAKDRWLVLHWGLRTWSPAVWVLESIQLRPWNLEVTVGGTSTDFGFTSTLHSLWTMNISILLLPLSLLGETVLAKHSV